MTLAEKLAAKRAGANPPPAASGGIVLKPSPNGYDEYALPATTARDDRRLASQEPGERIPMRHFSDGIDVAWAKAAHSLECELGVVIGPGPKDEAWLAVVPEGPGKNSPLLLMRLKLCILPGTFEPF